MGRDHCLSVIGEDFDHVLVDEDSKGQRLSWFQFEWSGYGSDSQDLLTRNDTNWEAGAAVGVALNIQSELLSSGGSEIQLQF